MAQVTKELIEKDFLPAIERGGPPPATLNEFKQMCHMSMRAIADDNVSRGTYDCVKAELDSTIKLMGEAQAKAIEEQIDRIKGHAWAEECEYGALAAVHMMEGEPARLRAQAEAAQPESQAQAVEGDVRTCPVCNATGGQKAFCLKAYGKTNATMLQCNPALFTPPTQQEALAPVGEPVAWLCTDNLGKSRPIRHPSGISDDDIQEYELTFQPLYTTPSPQAVPEGFVLVPTDAMVEAMDLFFENSSFVNVSPAQRRAMLESALSAAPPAPAKDGWISVEERLPEENGEYAVFLKPMLGGSFVSVSSYYKTAHAAISGWDTSRVLAWQPLPLPPKE